MVVINLFAIHGWGGGGGVHLYVCVHGRITKDYPFIDAAYIYAGFSAPSSNVGSLKLFSR